MALYSSDWAARWAKARPKTLIGDKMADPFKQLDKMVADWMKPNPVGKNAMRLPEFAKVIAAAQDGARATRAKCNKTLHAQAIAYIDTELKNLDLLAKDVQRHEKDYQVLMTQIRKWLVSSAKACQDLAQNPDLAHATQAAATCRANNQACNEALRHTGFTGNETTMVAQVLTRAEMINTTLRKRLDDKSKLAPGVKDARLDSDIAGAIVEVRQTVDRLRNPSKYFNPRATGQR